MITDFKPFSAYKGFSVEQFERSVGALAVCMECESLLFEIFGRYSQ